MADIVRGGLVNRLEAYGQGPGAIAKLQALRNSRKTTAPRSEISIAPTSSVGLAELVEVPANLAGPKNWT